MTGTATVSETRGFTIGALCTEFGVTPRTLRFYEAQGLLAPARDGQARRFSHRDRARLSLILRGKRFGFSLDEIRGLLDLYDIGDGGVRQLTETLAAARRHHAQLIAKRDDLTAAIGELEQQIALADRMLADKTGRR
jgi:DNA-binding transcriptional MerR regulator